MLPNKSDEGVMGGEDVIRLATGGTRTLTETKGEGDDYG